MKISSQYKKLNSHLHKDNPYYGISGKKYTQHILEIINEIESKDVLDYGCGKRTLEKSLGFKINNYDPCISGLDSRPQSADIVACTDVLEHIEPECLGDVLDDLMSLTKSHAFLTINTGAAEKTLSDGRNCHLIQKGIDWWAEKLRSRFNIKKSFHFDDRTVAFLCTSK
jgi:2-polyprenyl-3-methyl-5-hydroxy-6-metoxy-1,4-benzoquinol methylase